MQTPQSNLKAALWMSGSITSFLVMSVAGRALTSTLHVFQVMEMRSILGLLILMPLVLRAGGLPAMRTGRLGLHVARNVVHYFAQFAWLYALLLIPLAELISIEFTTPFWGALLAVWFLGERLNSRKIAAILLGLIGVLIIVRPGAEKVDPGHLIMLACAFGFSVSLIMVKALTRTESVVRIIFWMMVIQSLLGLVPSIAVWRTPGLELWPWILLISLTGLSSHFCLARALSHAEATVVMPMDFLRLPLSALIGWLLYSEQIDIFTAGGAALILAGNLMNVQRRAPVAAETA